MAAILGMFLAHNFLKEGRYALAIFEYHDFKFLPPELPPPSNLHVAFNFFRELKSRNNCYMFLVIPISIIL